MRFLAIIPARSGSKSIPDKNIAPLAGKPLLTYTIESALKSKHLDHVILNTDSPVYADIGRRAGAKVPFLRPAELAQDDTPSIDVVIHTLRWFAENQNYHPDGVILLQPTSPLRQTKHIDEAIDIFLKEQADTVVSVIEVPHRFNPFSIMKMEGKILSNYLPEKTEFNRYRRQEIPKYYARNGPAVLITKTEILLEKSCFYGQKILPYLMSEKSSVDIDNFLDLEIAEFLISKRND